ncbi:YmfQ family protein [Desulfocurvibacter africanus]|uniref:YmfQ family protein n=1 Tax=Desulfocurvibacter africanus TaxID=873 RepID=UPI00041A585D|nr:putative phage tail protein [Desulfocurvibacter africanus]
MRATTDYGRLLLALLPVGMAWPREDETQLLELCNALGLELSRVEDAAWGLLDEADPQFTVRMLPDWERACGLPDECSRSYEVLQERRAALLAKLTGRGGQSIAYLEEVAAELGYVIEITEFTPFRFGRASFGQAMTNDQWAFTFRVSAPEVSVTPFRFGRSAFGEPLRVWGNERLECALNKAKPANTIIIFAYGG